MKKLLVCSGSQVKNPYNVLPWLNLTLSSCSPQTIPLLEHTCGYLVAQASASTVDHHTHLSLMVDAHLLSSIVIENLIYNLDFCIVVACSQGPQL